MGKSTGFGFVVLLTLACSSCDCGSDGGTPVPASLRFGRFDGYVVANFGAGPRRMTLVQDFAYIDAAGKRWPAPKGSVIDGASIPQAFWSVLGGPFEGEYRNASVVHDVACDEMNEPWEDVHKMFYQACRCGGVADWRAKAMYWAVHNYGPRWEPVFEKVIEKDKGGVKITKRMVPVKVEPPDEELARKAKEYFQNHDPSLDEIRALKLR